jgi:hypothetical protein
MVMMGAFAAAVVVVIGIPIAKAYSRKIDADSGNPRLPPEVEGRLERIEQAVEAVAIEVERISEGQRYTTRLLAETESAGAARIPAKTSPQQDRVT